MASVFTAPGCIEHYVKSGNGSAQYLGTAVTAPEVEIRPAFLNVINDIGGRSCPMDRIADRESHFISTTLNRFDPIVYASLSILGGGDGVAVGGHNPATQGVLTFDTQTFELILVNAAVAANPAAFPNFPVGRRYYCCQIVGGRESTVGTRVKEVTLLIECNEIFNPVNRYFDLYSEAVAEITNGLPNPS